MADSVFPCLSPGVKEGKIWKTCATMKSARFCVPLAFLQDKRKGNFEKNELVPLMTQLWMNINRIKVPNIWFHLGNPFYKK
jgi:hypothetical protein